MVADVCFEERFGDELLVATVEAETDVNGLKDLVDLGVQTAHFGRETVSPFPVDRCHRGSFQRLNCCVDDRFHVRREIGNAVAVGCSGGRGALYRRFFGLLLCLRLQSHQQKIAKSIVDRGVKVAGERLNDGRQQLEENGQKKRPFNRVLDEHLGDDPNQVRVQFRFSFNV